MELRRLAEVVSSLGMSQLSLRINTINLRFSLRLSSVNYAFDMHYIQGVCGLVIVVLRAEEL